MAESAETTESATIVIAGKRVPIADPNAAALIACNTMMLALPNDQRQQVLQVMEAGAALRAQDTGAPCAAFRYAFTDSAGEFICVCGHRSPEHSEPWPG